MTKVLLKLLKGYKVFIRALWMFRPAPVIYSSCRFYPTCSEYAQEAISKYGAFHGSVIAVKRLARCQPLSKGGHDPVPKYLNS